MPDSFPLFWLFAVLCLPFAGFAGVFALRSGGAAGWVAVGLTTVGLGISVWLATQLPDAPVVYRQAWASFGAVRIPVNFQFDRLAGLMLVLVHLVGLLVQVYSISYLRTDRGLPRYFGFLQLFIGAMLGIILAGNLVVMYAFWELVGLASYLLIGFWYDRPTAVAAAKKAFLVNRIGDLGFLLGIFLTIYFLHTTELTAFTATLPTLAGVCLFMGCVGKSAQFPLLTWLPDAMEGPTPVSALLHAATMVAAGIFLLARIHPLLSPDALLIILLIGTITTLWGGYSALFQTDIKKVLAFSTISQLGLMVAAMGAGNPNGALFHLLTHAFFKAGLFLSAGAVIHAVHTQNMEAMGGLRTKLPVTFWVYTICAAALAGLPLFSGFLSKEAILGGVFHWAAQQSGGTAYLVPVLLLVSSGLTALYMARQWRLVFLGPARYEADVHPHEADALMTVPMLVLAVLSVAFWFALNPFSAHGSWFFHLFPVAEAEAPVWLALVSVLLAGAGIILGLRLPEPNATRFWVQASIRYGFLDEFYRMVIIQPVRQLAGRLYQFDQRSVDGVVNGLGMGSVVFAHVTSWLDRYLIDGLVNGIVWVAGRLGRLARSLQSGQIQSYIATAVVSLLLLLWWLLE